MDRYLSRISKILIIRMENKIPVEGYDTSFLHLESGRACEYNDDTEFDDGSVLRNYRDGPTLALSAAPFDGIPQAVECNGLKRELVICWSEGRRLKLQPSSVTGRNTLIESIVPCIKMRVVLEQSRAEQEPRIDPQTDDVEGSGPESQTLVALNVDPLMDVLVPVSLVFGQ
jgi:hypothetical protein